MAEYTEEQIFKILSNANRSLTVGRFKKALASLNLEKKFNLVDLDRICKKVRETEI